MPANSTSFPASPESQLSPPNAWSQSGLSVPSKVWLLDEAIVVV